MDTQRGEVAVSTHGLRKVYRGPAGDAVAVDGVTLEIAAGAFTAIMGPSGSGKTSLFNCLAGLDKPSAGEVRVSGTLLDELTERQLTKVRRALIGTVVDDGDLVPSLSVRENLLFPLSIAGQRPEAQWFEAVIEAAGLANDLKASPGHLTSGQQQRLAVARAILPRPAIILADEPTGRLPAAAGDAVLTLLDWAVTQGGIGVTLFTHDALAASRAGRVLFLSDGRLVAELLSPSRLSVLSRVAELESRRTALAGV